MTRSKAAQPTATPDRDRRDSGFTLIELLVVVVILGVLIAIAIPLYLNYRKGANDTAAKSDLRSAIHVLEQCLADAGRYPANADVPTTGGLITNTCGSVAGTLTIKLSAGTTLAYFTVSSSDVSGYIVGSSNSNGGKTYCYNSTKAGTVATTATAVTAYRATCGA